MQKWEYCIFTAYETSKQTQYTISYPHRVENFNGEDDNRLTVLEKLGQDGWELISVHPLTTGLKEFYFKRAAR